jgi:hypothetical protein
VVAQLNLFGPQIATDDAQIEAVAEELVTADPEGRKIGRVLRRTYDMLLDGQHTGRYRWEQLSKTEKTHFGTLAEINLQRAFAFAEGEAMDFAIRGIDVDCKFSQDPGDWMIPPEAVGHVILGLWASDDRGLWSLGLIRAAEQVLTSAAGNRDRDRDGHQGPLDGRIDRRGCEPDASRRGRGIGGSRAAAARRSAS